MKLSDRLKEEIASEIDGESQSIDKIKFGKLDISITVQDGQPHMFEMDVNRKKKCKRMGDLK